ncbi:MAG: hypothetical protein ACTSU6_04015 [Candidatus Njordarchaeales archaeon]
MSDKEKCIGCNIKEEELKKACHYTNLQPLWAKDNFSKGIGHVKE